MRPSVLAAMVYCGAAFGGSFLFMRVAAPELPALVVAFGRVAIAALVLTLVAGPRTLRALAPAWRGFLVLGVFMTAGPFLLFAYAERFITAGMGSIINATTPLWTVVVVAIWLRQRVSPKRLAALVVGFTGVGVIVGVDALALAPDAWLGAAMALVAASSYGIGLTFVRRHMMGFDPVPLALGQLVAASVLLLPGAVVSLPQARFELDGTLAVLGIAVVSTAIAWPVLFTINRAVGAVATSTVTFLNPIFGVLWGALFLHETISPTLLGGAGLVFVSLALVLDVRLPAVLRTRAAPTTD
jgi:drug/metabolite transporter (DMT)-like permease